MLGTAKIYLMPDQLRLLQWKQEPDKSLVKAALSGRNYCNEEKEILIYRAGLTEYNMDKWGIAKR